jgi:hypothetical protein
MPGLQVLSAPTNQPTLNPVVQSAPTQPALAPRVLSAPAQPKLAPKVVTQPTQPQLNPQVQTQPQGQQETLPVSYGHIIDSIAQAKSIGAQAQDILQAIIKQNPDAPATKDIQKALDGGVDPNTILAKIIQDNYTPSHDDPTQTQPGFVQGLIRGIVNPFLRFGVTAYDAVKSAEPAGKALAAAATGNADAQGAAINEATAQMGPRDLPFYGKVTPFGYQETQTPGGPVGKISAGKVLTDAAGSGAEVAANFVGGEGAAGAGQDLLKGSLKQGIKTGIKEGAKAGAVAGAGTGLQQDNPTIGGVIKSVAEGGVAGAVVGGAAAVVPAAALEIKRVISPDVESALTKAIKPASKNFNFSEALKTALPDVYTTAQQSGIELNSVENLGKAINEAKKGVWQEYQNLLGPNAKATIDGNAIADSMVSAIDKRFRTQNPAAAEAIEKVASTYRRQIPLGEAEDFLQSANNDLNSYYAKNKVGQKVAQSDPEKAYVIKEAEGLRNALYSKLDELTGKDASSIKKRYGALSNIENDVSKRINVAARQNPDSLAEQIGIAQGIGSIGKSVLNRNFGDALSGAAQITASHYLKTRNTSDALIETAFRKFGKAQAKLQKP